MDSAGTADAIGGRVSVLGAKFGLELERTAILSDGGEQYVLRIAPVAANTGASEIVDQWSVRAEKPISPTQNFTSVINTVITFRQGVHTIPRGVGTVPATSLGVPSSAYVLYYALTEGGNYYRDALCLGKWGTKAEVDAGTADVCRIDQLALFKFGSVIGLSNPTGTTPDTFSYDDIIFNPSQLTVGASGDIQIYLDPSDADLQMQGRLPGIPCYMKTDYTSGRVYISDRTYWSNAANKAAGLGDPCQLAGFIKGVHDLATYESGWRMPNWLESIAMHDEESSQVATTRTTIDPLGNDTHNGAYWRLASSGSQNYLGMITFSNGAKLPAQGGRSNIDGRQGTTGIMGWFWLADVTAGEGACPLVFNNVWVDAIGGNGFNNAFAVRCVPQ